MDIIIFYFITLFGLFMYSLVKSLKRPQKFPPGPIFMPWIGNIIQLRKEAASSGGQQFVFEKWSSIYNSDILGMKLGNELVVVVLKYGLVHEVHLQEVFEGRPDNFFLRLRTMGTRMGITCTDGQQWSEHRNFAMKQLRHVGFGRSQMDLYIKRETASLLKFIESTGASPVWPGSFLAPSVINVLWSLTAGKSIGREDKQLVRLLELLNRRSKVFDLSGGLLTQFPFLRFIAPNKCGYKLICQLNAELHNFFLETINEHKNSLQSGNNGNVQNDFIYSYIREMQERNGTRTGDFNETQLIMTILDLFIAGSQTTSITLDLALMMLSQNINMQNLLFEEINKAQLKSSENELSDISDYTMCPLINAFIMEVQRYFSITPITGPRRALWETNLGGYTIPKDTTILIGIRSVHMDKTHWGDPENFRPERFIDDKGNVLKDEYLMAFGQGRRRCLGDALARACLLSFLAHIILKFKIETSNNDLPSMTLLPGIVLSPKPYKIKFLKRI